MIYSANPPTNMLSPLCKPGYTVQRGYGDSKCTRQHLPSWGSAAKSKNRREHLVCTGYSPVPGIMLSVSFALSHLALMHVKNLSRCLVQKEYAIVATLILIPILCRGCYYLYLQNKENKAW